MTAAQSLEEVSDTLLPRRYQEEIFVRAQEGNVIAALDTGSGKTYISMLLIRWVAAHDAGRGKIIVFLVPKVALVQQQGEFIARQTTLRVRQFSGATAHDMGDRSGWRKILDEADVLVMTAQIFLNLLTHSHWQLEKVALIVFDECHHTRKNHAYNGIMREYFQTSPQDRPKIFGMTASPIWNPKNAAESLESLEHNLDAKVIAVKAHVEELMEHSPKPVEIVEEYPSPPLTYPEYGGQSLWKRLNIDKLPPELGITADKLRTKYEITHTNLGPYGADFFLYSEVSQRVVQLMEDAIDAQMDILPPHEISPGDDSTLIQDRAREKLHPVLLELEETLGDFRPFFDDDPGEGLTPTPVPLKWCSPKVEKLVQILHSRYNDKFQGIVFVEQRHVASCLSTILSRVPALSSMFKTGQLVGHGSYNRAQQKGMAVRMQQDTVKMFREGKVNLLIATSVAEEGLDFPACDLVIRFDPLQHMVGYLQSRGRARHKTSTFVIMIQEGQQSHTNRYHQFTQSEPHLKQVYQERDAMLRSTAEEDESEEREDPDDLAERERYVVPSTGAVLTYTSALGLLNHLCSLIPRDRFTPVHVPSFTGDFVATIQLPFSLPLPPEHLVYEGPPRRSKKEAKRAAAFLAVKRLHELNVFDDFLLPAKTASGRESEDPDGQVIPDVGKLPVAMDVSVSDPWTRGADQWLHIVYVDGLPTAGLVTGTQLPLVDLTANGVFISIGPPTPVVFDPRTAWQQRRAMEEYMRMGLWSCITGRGIALPLTCYLVPITRNLAIDFELINVAVQFPFGSYNWEGIGEEHYGHVMFMLNREAGRPMLLHKFRPDLSPMSRPPPGSRESGHATYHDYWKEKFTRKDSVPVIPTEGPCVEGLVFPRETSCAYTLDNAPLPDSSPPPAPTIVIWPLQMCRWLLIPEHMYHTFHALPALCHRITDVYRAREAIRALSLPPIQDDLMVQALTLPSANAGFNNQRLETYGDAVLKLGAVVHLYNRFPHRHEGQLDTLKRAAISNRTLLARGHERGIERFMNTEPPNVRVWRYVAEKGKTEHGAPSRRALREIARRGVQDCMEATLGASYATGGMDMALRAGSALGLCMGGPLPWRLRYGGQITASPVSGVFADLQVALGYNFRSGQLLVQAVSHPSFRTEDCSAFQRLEFLGDALIDLVVMDYLYKKYPAATSGQLSWARSRAVCSPALGALAVQRLGLHKLLLINNVELSVAIARHAPVLAALSPAEIVLGGWKYDPPKALCDAFESVLGAVLVDSGWDYERAAAVAELVLADLLAALSPDLPRDPVSEFMVWVAQAGCRAVAFSKSQSRPDARRADSLCVFVHGTPVAGPIVARNASMAKGLAAERARSALSDPASDHFLQKLCTCGRKARPKDASAPAPRPEGAEEAEGEEAEAPALDDETVEGFAALASIIAGELADAPAARRALSVNGEDIETLERLEELEVERMMQLGDDFDDMDIDGL